MSAPASMSHHAEPGPFTVRNALVSTLFTAGAFRE